MWQLNFLHQIPINKEKQNKKCNKINSYFENPCHSSSLFFSFLTQLNSSHEHQATWPGINLMFGSMALISCVFISQSGFAFIFKWLRDFSPTVTLHLTWCFILLVNCARISQELWFLPSEATPYVGVDSTVCRLWSLRSFSFTGKTTIKATI